MTGLLPICPDQMWSFSPSDVWAPGTSTRGQFSSWAELGLKNSCAMQNWQHPEDTSTFNRGVDARAVPSTIPISDEPVDVVFQATAMATPGDGGFNAYFPDSCMPQSTRPGGCTEDFPYQVAYRLANGAGEFVGRWTLAGFTANPFFDMTKGSCPNNHPEWSEGYETDGMPCRWTVQFATDAEGAPILTSAMQVAVIIGMNSGTMTVGEFTSYRYSVDPVVPMLFEPGASTSLSLRPSGTELLSGSELRLTATATGPQPGTPINFYRRRSGGDWSLLGQALTNDNGKAVLSTTVSTTATYRARVVSNGTETITSPEKEVVALRSLSLKTKQLPRSRARFTGDVGPDDDTGKVHLQLRKRKEWQTVERTAPEAGGVSWVLKVPDGTSQWRLLTKGTDDYGKSVSRTKTVSR